MINFENSAAERSRTDLEKLALSDLTGVPTCARENFCLLRARFQINFFEWLQIDIGKYLVMKSTTIAPCEEKFLFERDLDLNPSDPHFVKPPIYGLEFQLFIIA